MRGDFGDMRQLVVEYDATRGPGGLRAALWRPPVLSILIRAHQYLIARYDFDGFRIDTVKYVDPERSRHSATRCASSRSRSARQNFFTFGEVYDDEETIAAFMGRNGGSGDGFGIDAALDFPLFFKLPGVAKGLLDVARRSARVFDDRKAQEAELLSSHGEAGRFFVSFLDNHDQHERIQHPARRGAGVAGAGAAVHAAGDSVPRTTARSKGSVGQWTTPASPDLSANESTREALWGKPNAFRYGRTPCSSQIQALSRLRARAASELRAALLP